MHGRTFSRPTGLVARQCSAPATSFAGRARARRRCTKHLCCECSRVTQTSATAGGAMEDAPRAASPDAHHARLDAPHPAAPQRRRRAPLDSNGSGWRCLFLPARWLYLLSRPRGRLLDWWCMLGRRALGSRDVGACAGHGGHVGPRQLDGAAFRRARGPHFVSGCRRWHALHRSALLLLPLPLLRLLVSLVARTNTCLCCCHRLSVPADRSICGAPTRGCRANVSRKHFCSRAQAPKIKQFEHGHSTRARVCRFIKGI